jgi:hypothetical protein
VGHSRNEKRSCDRKTQNDRQLGTDGMGQIMKHSQSHDAVLKKVRYHGVNDGSHYSANIHFPVHLNSLPAKCCYGGEKKSVLLAKHKDTNIPTMMEPFCSSAAWF